MEQMNKISKMCNAKVRFTWPGFSEAADCGALRKKEKGKKKKKKKKKETECPPPTKGAQDEEGKGAKKKRLECEACTRGPAARGNASRAALWCCTRCALMFCGAMRLFVAAAGVLGLCLTMFFIFAPEQKKQ